MLMSGWLQAQAPNCGGALLSPFCNGIAQYPANFDGTGLGNGPQAPAGPNYDCLGTQGNPSYFSLTIDQTGSIDFVLDNTNNLDIDFILWGPFTNVSAAQLACDSMGQGGIWGNVADCSYSAVGQEPVSIPNAVSGEVYILMVTNYTNTATNIFSTLNTGTGAVACPCDIPFSIDTLPAAAGNMGYFTDTTNGINQFVVCPNNTLGFRVSASSNLNDTLGLYAPFTTVNNVFTNNTVLSINPNAPTRYDSLDVFGLITPNTSEIGINNFTLGLRNSIFTGGIGDSSCFDLLNVQVIVPGVNLSDRNVCPGQQLQIMTDSIPSTVVGSSSYTWRQLSGISVAFSSTTSPSPTITIPPASSSSSNDSIVLVVDYNYGSLCPMSDTMVLRFSDLTMTATALPDSICTGGTSTLGVLFSDSLTTPICDDYEVSPIPYAPITGTGILVSNFSPNPDDGVSAPLPIGFSFDFFCNTYTQFVMSTNGFISFDLSAPNGCCSGDFIPTNVGFDPNNLIALAWNDLNVTGNTLEYFTVGTAPNRILVVNYNAVSHFPGPSTAPVTVQALLYETSNIIEIHTTVQPDNFGIHTQGIENANGSRGFAAPGRNGQAWTATNDAYRFAPRSNGPFYNWTPTATLSNATARNPIATPNVTTSFVVEVTDNVCIYTDTVEVAVSSSFAAPVVNCDSASLTSISFSWSDIGLPPTGFYEYSTDGGATWVNIGNTFSTTLTGLMSNTSYTILVRGNANTGSICPISTAGSNTCATLNPSCANNPTINITLTTIPPVCNGDSTGCISAVVTGGSGNNNWGLTWSTGQVDSTQICNLPVGSYTLVVADTINPSTICIDSQTIQLTEPSPLILTVDSSSNPTCSGSADGYIVISTTGGTGGTYSYNWSNGAITDTLTNLNDGSYMVTVSDSVGCTTTGQVILNVPNPIVVTVDNVTNNGCAGQANGGIDVTAIGGLGTLSYLWSNGTTNQDLSAVSEGIYSLTVTDINGCFVTIQDTIVPTTNLVVNDSIETGCVGDPIIVRLNVSGGSIGLYNYNWGSASSSLTDTAQFVLASNTNFAVLVTVTDGFNGCTIVDTIDLVGVAPVVVSLDNIQDIPCGSTAPGQININTTGGSMPYTYNWSDGSTAANLSSTTAGAFSVTVTDVNGCTGTAGPFTINQALSTNVSIDTINLITACNGQATGALAASSTDPNVTFAWSNGSTDSSINNLTAGSYTVVATNSSGCIDSATVEIIAPTLPTLNAAVQTAGTRQVSIPLGTTVTLIAGSTNFNYLWTSFADPVTGNANISNNNLATTTASPDPAGDYWYIVTASATTGATTCSVVDSVMVTVEQPFNGVPDAFTPNNDGINDFFRPAFLTNEEVTSFRIFNRWGQIVYNGDANHGNGWDGTYQGVPQPADVYIYSITYKRASEPEERQIKGEMTLIR